MTVITPSDESLLAEFLQGKKAPFTILVKRYEIPLLNFIFKFIRDRDEAEDIFQETFLRVVKRASCFNPAMTFKTWLYTIALNLMRTRAKRRSAAPLLAGDYQNQDISILETMPSSSTTPEDNLADKEIAKKITDAVNSLSQKHREVFILYQYQNFSYEEIAHVLNRPLGTIKSQMHYAVAYLKKELENIMKTGEI
ncbi:MAG: sigma-70 family RNA polymerase sigma factor [Planctomycetota bacterium]